MKKFFLFCTFILFTVSLFSQEGLTLVNRKQSKKAAFISEGSKIAVTLTNGTKLRGYLGKRDSSGFVVEVHRRFKYVNYHEIQRVTLYKEMEYFSWIDWMFNDTDACFEGCADGCGNSDASGYVVLGAVCIVAAVVVVELTFELLADAANDKHYNMAKEWYFVAN